MELKDLLEVMQAFKAEHPGIENDQILRMMNIKAMNELNQAIGRLAARTI